MVNALTVYAAADFSADPPGNGAGALVQRFEAALAAQDWPCGIVFGPESLLAEQYEASPYLVRQALRILEARGLGRMRRGSPGGLQLHLPTARMTAQAMMLHLSAVGVTSQQVAASRRQVQNYWPQGASSRATQFIDTMLQELDHCFVEEEEGTKADDLSPNRALGVARRIVRDARSGIRGRGTDVPLGTIEDLCDRYHSCRPVMTQAVRIMEDFELVTLMRGRSGGLRLRSPSSSMITRVTYGHFAAQQIVSDHASEIIWAANTASAVRAAERSAHDLAELRHLRDLMTPQAFMAGTPWGQIATFRCLADRAGDPVLHMILRCFFVYKFRAGMIPFPRISHPHARRIVDTTNGMIDAVMRGRSDLAEQAVTDCRQSMHDWHFSDGAARV